MANPIHLSRQTTLVVCMPTRTTPTPETLRALRLNSPPHCLLMETGKPVDEARNALADRILALDPLPEIVVLLDDDAWWEKGIVENLVAELRSQPSLGMLAGSFSQRIPHAPTTARRIAQDITTDLIPDYGGTPGANCTVNDIVLIEEVGLHACALRTSALRAVGPNPFNVIGTLAEDQAFCARLRKCDVKIACAPAFPFLHVDKDSGFAYAPCNPLWKIDNGRLRKVTIDELKRSPNVKATPLRVDENGVVIYEMQHLAEPSRSYGAAVDGARVKANSPDMLDQVAAAV